MLHCSRTLAWPRELPNSWQARHDEACGSGFTRACTLAGQVKQQIILRNQLLWQLLVLALLLQHSQWKTS
jgi:hypothetical protein